MNIVKGIFTALVASFLIGLLFAYTFRLPIPLGGMIGPFGTVSTYSIGFFQVAAAVFVAWMFYGFLGGFLILPVFGGIAGYLTGRAFDGKASKNQMIVAFSAIVSAIPVVFISTLDYIVGPW